MSTDDIAQSRRHVFHVFVCHCLSQSDYSTLFILRFVTIHIGHTEWTILSSLKWLFFNLPSFLVNRGSLGKQHQVACSDRIVDSMMRRQEERFAARCNANWRPKLNGMRLLMWDYYRPTGYMPFLSGASTPYKRWSKCTMEKVGEVFLQKLREEVH